MKYDRFFILAKEAGIEEAELYIRTSRNLSFSLFHGEVDNYKDNNGYSILARGLINGRFGAARCDTWSADKAKFLVDEIAKNAKVVEDDDPQFIFPGSEKYKKISTYNKELENVSIEEKLNKLHELESGLRSFDNRIVEVQAVEYSETTTSTTLLNSKGLKLTQKSNYFVYVGVVLAKDGSQIKSGYDLHFGNDFNAFSVNDLVKRIGNEAVSQLGGEPCDSATYKAVLSPDVVKSLLLAYIGSADAEEIQKQSSLFIGKLNTKVASSKVTVEDRPLQRSVFARWFDDEGVATYNKFIIKNGVLSTYLYTLTTAAKDGVTTTGNGYRYGDRIAAGPAFLYMKPGKKTQEELFASVGNGVYITSISGLHAGLNAQSGNFSLQSTGFLIKDGKKDRPLDIITVSGNLMDVFKDIVEVGSDSKVDASGASTPSVIVKKLVVSGK